VRPGVEKGSRAFDSPIHLSRAPRSKAARCSPGHVSGVGSAVYFDVDCGPYLDADADLPAVTLFDTRMRIGDPDTNFQIQTLSGRISAQLFVQALRQTGSLSPRTGLEAALDTGVILAPIKQRAGLACLPHPEEGKFLRTGRLSAGPWISGWSGANGSAQNGRPRIGAVGDGHRRQLRIDVQLAQDGANVRAHRGQRHHEF
jgi:hypothetical protein